MKTTKRDPHGHPSDPTRKKERLLTAAAFSVLALFSVGLYLNSFNTSFHFDDMPNIIENPYIRDVKDVPLFLKGLHLHGRWYRALPTLSFALNYHFHKLRVFGYHLVNVILHVLSGIFVYLIARMLFQIGLRRKELDPEGRPAGRTASFLALLTAAIFVSHPIQVNTVTYIIGRNEGMASLFYLVTFFLFIRMSLSLDPLIKTIYFLGVAIFFAVTVLSKEIGFTLPLILILFDLFFVAGTWESVKRRLKIYGVTCGALLLMIALFLGKRIFTVIFQQSYSWTPWENLLTQSNVIVQYFKLILFPLPGWLNIDHDFSLSRSLLEYPTWASVSVIALILIGAALCIRKSRIMAFSLFWFFIVLIPSSSIIPIWDMMVEYRLYLALFSFAMLVSLAFHFVLQIASRYRPGRWSKVLAAGVCIVLLAFYSVVTIQRNEVFKDEFTLWSDTVRKSPYKMRAHHNLGRAFFLQGQIDRAIQEGEIALRLSASFTRKENVKFVLNLLGGAYFVKGELDRAAHAFNKAIEIDPNFATPYFNVGCVYVKKGVKPKALEYLRKAISLDQDYKRKARTDKDMEPLWGDREFQEIVK
jgi:protein O-mannosyl-transferase